MVLWGLMDNNEQGSLVRAKLAELQEKGWTLASIGRALDQSSVTIETWNAGTRTPANLKSVLASLEHLLKQKRIPKKKVYTKGRKRTGITNNE